MNSYSSGQHTGETRLIAALCYLIPIAVSALVLVSELRGKRYLRYHGYQGLAAGVVLLTMYLLLIPGTTWLLLHIPLVGWGFACLAPFFYLTGIGIQFYWGYMAYQGQTFSIPILGTIARTSMQD